MDDGKTNTLLAQALARNLAGRTAKQQVAAIKKELARAGVSASIHEKSLRRFLMGQVHNPHPRALDHYSAYLKAVDRKAYASIYAPTSEDEEKLLLDALMQFFSIDNQRQQHLGEMLHSSYTIIRDAWMHGAGRKGALAVSQLDIKSRGRGLYSIKETQKWADPDYLEAEDRSEFEYGIAVAWAPHFAFIMRSQQHNGLILHIFDHIDDADHRIIRATGISQPIVSNHAQIPTALLLIRRPVSEFGGLGLIKRRDFATTWPVLYERFVSAERSHFLTSETQASLPLF